MAKLNIIADGDGIWPDLPEKDALGLLIDGTGDEPVALTVAGLAHGMESGRPSVAIRADFPDGRVVVLETSLRLFTTAARALAARYGKEYL